ncbi:hypothetical protein SODALDRAFT_33149 [Sodiomyces alkalinus F11]|uniref:Transmembrane protein n=1 Tax=Sodiomyces alkalinus (strain CBS 110278 / VKM F-3762 / F11) TaxID=1314773 RepID=A0A3N2Q8T3_SODAK|nr:hypothetical protein SODALDRAFT_33149 [Sodiomyces alkalinus F11]ROT43191.1 hypothetical protein SODALDRAFT_33149 [Sodiomyces alkalinus F11]
MIWVDGASTSTISPLSNTSFQGWKDLLLKLLVKRLEVFIYKQHNKTISFLLSLFCIFVFVIGHSVQTSDQFSEFDGDCIKTRRS